MNGVIIPFLPTGLWMFSAALAIMLIFISFIHYLYYRRRIQAVVEDGKTAADLAAERETLQADVDALREWIGSNNNEIMRIKAEREEQEKIRAELDDLMNKASIQDQKNETLRREVGELENQRHMVTQSLKRMKEEFGDLKAKREEALALQKKLAELRDKVDEARKAVENLAGVEAKLAAFNAERVAMEQRLSELKAASEIAIRESNAKRLEAEDAAQKVETTKKEMVGLLKEKTELTLIVDVLRGEKSGLMRDLQNVKKMIEERKKSEEEARIFLEKLEQAKIQRRIEQEIVDELRARKASLEQQVKGMEGRAGGAARDSEDVLYSYSDLLKVPPVCLDEAMFTKGKRDGDDEWEVLGILRAELRKDELKFPDRIIDAFHTSLKCHDINPLTVLAGVSGTGKTLLPTYYAGIMGMHSLVMAVQPRWDSPQDMFGFYNYIEKQYKATELSRALLLMDPYRNQREVFKALNGDWTRDRMLLVLLDEMNLARTEYYFSEFLSKLELRRLVKNPESPTDRERAEIELDSGPSKDIKFRFWVGRNVLFVGTMNEDETTQTLSDKVLDRSNLLRFGRPDEKTKPSPTGGRNSNWSDQYLSVRTWKSWQRGYDDDAHWYGDIAQWTGMLNEALDRVGRPFGFRVQQAIASYVANYPLVDENDRYKLAFADQIEQKIIPKLRGVEIGEENANNCLNELQDIIEKLGDTPLVKAFEQARSESEQIGLFQWRGVTRAIAD